VLDPIKRLLGRGGEGNRPPEPVEDRFPVEIPESGSERVTIVVSRVSTYDEMMDLINELYEGNILIIDVKPLLKRRGEHERAIEELKRTVVSLGGFVGVIKDTVILATADNVDVERR